jgi:hypothetical protein
MTDNHREKIEDKIIESDLNKTSFHNKLLVRIGSKGKKFSEVDFSHTYFEHCYFRNCVFNSCNFNGCKFINCNFTGSSFPGSKFEYALFDKTIIENDILDNNCPSNENLTFKFARALRINYQGIGDSESVNKAIRIELKATKIHLYDSWKSKKAYYRSKYQGWDRLKMFISWINFKFQEFIWGNGENLWYLFRTGFFIWVAMTTLDVIYFKNPVLLTDYWKSFIEAPTIFFGVTSPEQYPKLYLSLIVLVRLVGFALFMSIILKRFNRR